MAKGGYDLHHHSNFINLNSKLTTVHMELFFLNPTGSSPSLQSPKKMLDQYTTWREVEWLLGPDRAVQGGVAWSGSQQKDFALLEVSTIFYEISTWFL
jgi:hypothetical protein